MKTVSATVKKKTFTTCYLYFQVLPTQTSETMNSVGYEDMLQPDEQHTEDSILCPSRKIKLELGLPGNTDTNSCKARRWVVAVNGVVTEVSTLVCNISTENSTMPIDTVPGGEDVISVKGRHDVVVKTEVIQSDSTEDIGTIHVKRTNIGATEGCCDALNKCEATRCDRRKHVGAEEETISNICPTEECHSALNVSEVIQHDRTQDGVIQQGVTSNNASMEERCDVVNSKKQLQGTDKTKSTMIPAYGQAPSVGIPVKSKRRPVLKCSVCSKMFGRLRCLRVHETCHRKHKLYSSQNAQHERYVLFNNCRT